MGYSAIRRKFKILLEFCADGLLIFDLIVKQGRSLIPVEIKSSMTFHADFIKPIRVFCKQEKAAYAPALIYAGEPLPYVYGVRCVNYGSAHTLLGNER